MRKTSPIRLLFILSLLLLFPRDFFVGYAIAADTGAGTIQIENRNHANATFSCDVKLSGVKIRGDVFTVLFAESGRMKRVSGYPANETVKVMLQDVSDTDCVKILWTDERYMPLASPAVLRLSGNNAAAHGHFAKQLASLRVHEGASGSSDADKPYALARLLVSCAILPDLSAYEGKVTTLSGPDNLHILQFYNPVEAEQCEKYLKSCPSVRYVEPDAVMTANAETDSKTSYQPHSWGASKAGIDEYTANLRERGVRGGVIVAVVDSGAEANHPLLRGRLLDGYDFVEYDDVPQDENGHGTHVAGTVADCTHGMDVKIMPVRVLNAFASGSYISIAEGIRYAANHGANIINLSLGSDRHSQTIDDAIQDALSKNVTVVIAAGNKNGNVQYFCPSHMEDCLTVAAVDSDLKRFELSNYGDAVDLAAPGVDIESGILNGTYGEMTGTSMAAPHVSAAALLMCERGTGQTPFQISSLLRGAATDLGEPGKDVYFGAGFLNMRPFIVHSAYALLYADGELVFQKDSAPAPDRELVKAYPVAVSGDAGGQYAAWYERRAEIRKVTFTESIRPTSSVLWFYGCTNLTEIQGLEYLDASELTDMSQMFARCTSLRTLDLSALDTSKVKSLNGMFFFCEKLTELDLTGWNTENATDTRDMFMACAALGTVYASETFTTNGVTESVGMFGGCTSLIGGAGTQYDSAHTDKEYARMDGGASAPGYFTDKNAPIPSTDIYAVLYTDGELVFQNNNRTESGRAVTDVYKVEGNYSYPDYEPWYGQRDNITTVTFADKIQPASTAFWFYGCNKLERVDNIRNLDTANVTDMCCMFSDCSGLTALDVTHFDTASVTDMADMFGNCSGLMVLDVSHFDTANVNDMGCMFYGSNSLTALDVTHFNTANVTDMSAMFQGCSGLTALDVSNFNTANVTDMSWMFFYCSGLTALELSHFDTANVTNMHGMFSGCSGLTALDVSHFDTANVTDMYCMFSHCSGLTTLDVTCFDSANVTFMYGMFWDCSALTALDLSAFNTSNVTYMYDMFAGCSSLKTIYASGKFTTASVTKSNGMFYGCTSLIGGSGTKFDEAHTDKEYARMDGGTSAPGYFTRKTS